MIQGKKWTAFKYVTRLYVRGKRFDQELKMAEDGDFGST